jgi:hypothetical protein
MNNPFNITKAVDYTDNDIIRYWVDYSDGGFQNLLKPTSLMPMLILGSKGSGKTHLMRFFSYQLQKIRHSEKLLDGIVDDGYIGIYLRCSGLNSDRFKGKGQSNETWSSVFAYYMELWVGQLLLNIINDFKIDTDLQYHICEDIKALFESESGVTSGNLVSLVGEIKNLQNKVDYSVNNSAITRTLAGLEILLSPGKFTTGIPKILVNRIPLLKNIVFVYLIDELENINLDQQKLINTLYREKEIPVTYRIGARLYGIKTFETLGGGEENKEGSEYEKIELDSFYRENDEKYEAFVRSVCFNRLTEGGVSLSQPNEIDNHFEPFDINVFFEKIRKSKYAEKHWEKLRKKVESNGKYDVSQVEEIVMNLSYSNDLLIERTNLYLFYKDWNSRVDLITSSRQIKAETAKLGQSKSKTGRHSKALDYFKYDFIDQISRDARERIRYVGFKTFIKMSSGVPRNLLNILKHTYRWSYFSDNIRPFVDGKISIESQLKGVNETSEWFFEDNRIPSEDGKAAFVCISRIGRMLQDLRYSDVPPECSISSFSIQYEAGDEKVTRVLDTLEKYSFLLSTDMRRDKNTNAKLRTYKLNGIIAPKWELSIHTRGVITISAKELLAIFETGEEGHFVQILNERLLKYNAPFFTYDSPTLF